VAMDQDEFLRLGGIVVPLVEIHSIVQHECGVRLSRCVDEVYAEVLLHIWQKYRADPEFFLGVPGVLGFCRRDAKFAVLHLLRDERSHRVEFRDPQALYEAHCAEEDERKRRELLPLLADSERAASLLVDAGPKVREVFLLRCKHMSNKEIASRIGQTPSNASKLYKKALELLKRKLAGVEGDPNHVAQCGG